MALALWKRELKSARKAVLSKMPSKGRFSVINHKSKTGTCKICATMAGKHNIAGGAVPPYHPNCKCGVK